MINNNDDKELKKNNSSKRKKEIFWDLFLTGGWYSFEKEWKNSRSFLQTTMMFLTPVLVAGIIVLLAIFARNH